MAKKKKTSLNIINLVAALIGFVSVIMFIVLPMIKLTLGTDANNIETSYKGLGMIFGGTINCDVTTTITAFGNTKTATETVEINDIAFNAMACISLLLVAFGSVFTLISTLKKNKLLSLVSAILLLVGGILMFTIKGSCVEALSATSGIEYFSLGIGAIISAIMSIFAGGIVLLQRVLKK